MAQPVPQEAPWWAKYEAPGASSAGVRMLSFAGPAAAAAVATDAPSVAAAEAREQAARPAASVAAQRALYKQVDVPRITLRDGHTIPAVGLGTWKATPGEVRRVTAAVGSGVHARCCFSRPGSTSVCHSLTLNPVRGTRTGAVCSGSGPQSWIPPHRLRSSVPE